MSLLSCKRDAALSDPDESRPPQWHRVTFDCGCNVLWLSKSVNGSAFSAIHAPDFCAAHNPTVIVLETDQFSPNLHGLNVFDLADILGKSGRLTGGVHPHCFGVLPGDRPRWARTWYAVGDNGELALYDANWDTSG